jgi:hypothetical protein
MARKHAKRMGPVAYYLYRDARSYQAGKPPLHTKFGPYASMKEAEAKREEEEYEQSVQVSAFSSKFDAFVKSKYTMNARRDGGLQPLQGQRQLQFMSR